MNNPALFDLTGKKALVTGGAMGIGRAYAIALARAGADIVIADINETMGLQTIQLIRDAGRKGYFIDCDISNQQQVESMTAEVVNYLGCLDIAVNNAGITGSPALDEQLAKQAWDQVLAVNLTGLWLCACAQAKQMMRQQTGGKIINTASGAASLVFATGAYSASKAGVVHLTRSLAAQWGRFNINVNAISPGAVLTPLMAGLSNSEREQLRDTIPLGHLQRPCDLEGAIIFLASPASDYITGVDLAVDGGIVLAKSPFPVARAVKPRVAPKEEVVELIQELDELEIAHKEGIKQV